MKGHKGGVKYHRTIYHKPTGGQLKATGHCVARGATPKVITLWPLQTCLNTDNITPVLVTNGEEVAYTPRVLSFRS